MLELVSKLMDDISNWWLRFDIDAIKSERFGSLKEMARGLLLHK